jgi:glycosyltransferase involved in cell wall biosynthesis
MATLTIFTPAYNRAHTIWRTYESLCRQTSKDFCWLVIDDGSTDGTRQLIASWIGEEHLTDHFSGQCPGGFFISYIWKENGGLHTGYNTAYANIDTELCVCIDSDDWMPDDAVEKIVQCWEEKGSSRFAGIIGLDFDTQGKPLGGFFPDNLQETYFLDLYIDNIHRADTKEVMRTDLMKQVAPQVGFEGEKNFNPVYMLLQVCDNYPLIVLNENLCIVEYQQDDSMSRGIYRQYMNSPRSFAKLRLLEMNLKRNTFKHKFRSAIHYVSSCLIAQDKQWLSQSTHKVLVLAAVPFGLALSIMIKNKAKK